MNIFRLMDDALGGCRLRLARCAFAYAALFCVAGLVPQQAVAQHGTASQALERRVKAAFLYKFLGYAEFPAGAFAEPGSALVMAVNGSDEMAAELTRIVAGRTVNGRPIAVRSVRDGEGTGAHLLFVAGSDCSRVDRVLRAPVRALLVVSECDSGFAQGSVINFRIIDERVRFDVSLDAAQRNGVKLSSRLLTVANKVRGAP